MHPFQAFFKEKLEECPQMVDSQCSGWFIYFFTKKSKKIKISKSQPKANLRNETGWLWPKDQSAEV